ncbi:RlpA-like double-psi beta-barrel-protein domain-containing protein-containing protein [Mycena capillaripes]|nr:RlpA-like double-psi beta-barrel-protein domain-containing protein-containing protein [Mycena capillaripes]
MKLASNILFASFLALTAAAPGTLNTSGASLMLRNQTVDEARIRDVTVDAAAAHHGRVTFYLPNGAVGACGHPIKTSAHAVALASAQYNDGAHCGKKIKVQHNGKSIIAKVVDLCPGCPSDGLDLTRGAFKKLAKPAIGVIEADWQFF